MKPRRVSDRSVNAIIERINKAIKKHYSSHSSNGTYSDPILIEVSAGLTLAQLSFISDSVYRNHHPWLTRLDDSNDPSCRTLSVIKGGDSLF